MANPKPEDVECENLKDLKIIVEKAKEWGIETVVIGGYAVRAFTNAYRHTKDIDMAITREDTRRFTQQYVGCSGYLLQSQLTFWKK
jgi:hypothetical protein